MVETTYRIPNAPRLALLADLHGRPYDHVITSLRAHHPSLICLAGDFIYGTWPEGNVSPLVSQTNVLPFFRACASLAPSFLSLGNHEQMLDEADIKEIEQTGVVVLDNTWTEWNGVVIAGLTSGYVTDYRRAVEGIRSDVNRYPKQESIDGLKGVMTASERVPDTAWLEEFAAASPDAFHICLSHQPEYFPLVPDAVDLILSGHAHGGQIRLFNPFKREWRGLWCPGQGFWAKWTRGVYERNRLVVSAGLSNTTWVPRVFNPTEVVYLESP